MKNFSMYFFSETRPLLGHFLKKSVFCPPEMSNTCKNFQNPKIGQKWLSMGPPPFFHLNFFYQNDSEWPEMDFKHNFKKYGILSVRPPPPGMENSILFFSFFFEGFPYTYYCHGHSSCENFIISLMCSNIITHYTFAFSPLLFLDTLYLY